MSVLPKATLQSNVIADIFQNSDNEITGADTQARLIDIIQSALNRIDDANLLGLKLYDETRSYAANDTCHYGGFIYRANSAAFGAFNPALWTELGSAALFVSSVGLAFAGGLGSIFFVSNSPVTSAGNLTLAAYDQNPNTFFAGPASGGVSAPAYRALVIADLPSSIPVTKLASGSNGQLLVISSGTPVWSSLASQNIVTTSEMTDAISAAITGLKWKNSCRAATTANITLSGAQTIDGVALIAGDRVLVKNQSTATQNGIYVVAAGSWSRASDADSGAELTGATVGILEGTINGDVIYKNTNDGITLTVTNITFVDIATTASFVGGTGISVSGNTIAVDNTVLRNITTVTTQSGATIDFANRMQKRTTSGATAISVTAFTNVAIGRSVYWHIDSTNAGDTLSVVVAGATILATGFGFIPAVRNEVFLTCIDTNLYRMTCNPII